MNINDAINLGNKVIRIGKNSINRIMALDWDKIWIIIPTIAEFILILILLLEIGRTYGLLKTILMIFALVQVGALGLAIIARYLHRGDTYKYRNRHEKTRIVAELVNKITGSIILIASILMVMLQLISPSSPRTAFAMIVLICAAQIFFQNIKIQQF